MSFPLILVSLCAIGLLIWLYDRLILHPRRQAAVVALRSRYPGWDDPDSDDHEAFEAALPEALHEPPAVELTKSLLPVLLVVFVLRSFVVEPFKIPSSSMEPTLEVGDYILVNKFVYGIRLPVIRTEVLDLGEPARGDIMVFFPPNDDRYFIKRVVGLPGDRIAYVRKQLYINGERAEQSLLQDLPGRMPPERLLEEDLTGVTHRVRHYPRRGQPDFRVTVPAGHYFMMGDNRDNSRDSRVWGMVPERNIVGKAFAIWMHWESLGSLPRFDRVGGIR